MPTLSTFLQKVSVFSLLTFFTWSGAALSSPAGDVPFKKGLQYSQQKKWSQAEAEYRKAVALDPKNATYKSYLADALAAQGKFDKARESYKQSDTAKKNFPQANTKKPVAGKPVSKPTGKAPSTRPPAGKPSPPRTGTTSRTTPDKTIPIPKIGDDVTVGGDGTKNNGGGLPPAVFTLPDGRKVTVTGKSGQTITIPPDDGDNAGNHAGEDKPDILNDAHYIKGREYCDEEKWPQAEAEFLAALKAFPRAIEGWDALGDVFFKQGKWKDAEQAHRTALRFAPNDDGYFHAQIALDLLKQNRRAEALKEAKQAQQLGLQDHEVFDELELNKTNN